MKDFGRNNLILGISLYANLIFAVIILAIFLPRNPKAKYLR